MYKLKFTCFAASKTEFKHFETENYHIYLHWSVKHMNWNGQLSVVYIQFDVFNYLCCLFIVVVVWLVFDTVAKNNNWNITI